MTDFILICVGYFCGSIPFGLFIAKWAGGIDIRKHGSGNIGATNVGRIMGAKWFAIVMLLDGFKGLVPTLAAVLISQADFSFEVSPHTAVFAGLCAVLGHMYPCWLKFKGGKGVATALGVVGVLAPPASLFAAICFGITFLIWRTVSISSLLAASSFAVLELYLLSPEPFSSSNWSRGCFSLLVPGLIIYRHRSNIARLIRGEEHAFRKKKEEPVKPE
ncbi:MAG: glycerol-3-phosphate 1-O-acyltransferase PlsY [Planctomycetaceae bacterium]|nr:glycerol-3-phosphate 1-O-acyltransferase PlsY [Planctomycetaceae bacterium]